jgi:hypothetical protein
MQIKTAIHFKSKCYNKSEKGTTMKKSHELEWRQSKLNIRCWECSEILVTISTDGSSLDFKSIAEYLEIGCPICHTACEYSLIKKDDGLFKSHDWDSDIDSFELNGETGEINRNLLRQYKTLLLASENTEKFMENEFYIVGDYLEFLTEMGKEGSSKNDADIADYLIDYRYNDDLSKSGEKLFRRAINRFMDYGKKNRILASAHPEMANFRNIGVGLRILILKILTVFLWLKFSPALILQKFSHPWTDTIYSNSRITGLKIRIPLTFENLNLDSLDIR